MNKPSTWPATAWTSRAGNARSGRIRHPWQRTLDAPDPVGAGRP